MIHFARWKVSLILLTCFIGILFSIPNFLKPESLSKLPQWFPRQTISLGLDLQGGSHLLLEIDMDAAVKDRLEFLMDSVRRSLKNEKVGYINLKTTKEGISFNLRDPLQFEHAISVLQKHVKEITITPSNDNHSVHLAFTEDALKERKQKVMEQSIEIVRRRIDAVGTKEPTIQRQGDERILVQLPGIKDPAHVKNLIGTTAKMAFRLLHQSTPFAHLLNGNAPPSGTEILLSDDKGRQEEMRYVVEKKDLLTGDNLEDASVNFDEYQRPQVSFKLDAVGARIFGDITRENVGRYLAIVLDKDVISAPHIQTHIQGGSGVITGQFTVQEANDLALLMRAGALPAPLQVIEERTVGPDLGADSIAAGQYATLLGTVFVLIFMLISYSLFGIIANIALLFNLLFLLAALSAVGATLTLPGIAGIALTLGMAVDANVLIFERIKEEIRLGRKMVSAIDAGFRQAMTTIIDSNVTTLFAAAALYLFGSGPIKGFGVTLAFGIMISMFTAISLTRLMIVYWLKIFKAKTLPI